MIADGENLEWTSEPINTILKKDSPWIIPPKLGSSYPSSFRGEDFSIFSIGGHFGRRAGSSDMLLKGDHLRTAKFGSNWPSGFREEISVSKVNGR